MLEALDRHEAELMNDYQSRRKCACFMTGRVKQPGPPKSKDSDPFSGNTYFIVVDLPASKGRPGNYRQ